MQQAATSLSITSVELIERAYAQQSSRACRLETPDGAVVVKGQRPARDAIRYTLLGLLAWLLGNPLMKPVPIHGGLQSQRVEVERLRRLAAAGLSVPSVLYEADHYFVMQGFSGVPLDSKLALSEEHSSPAFCRGLQAISHVHSSGECLSQGFARNILINETNGLWFIDHEDNPLEVLSLPQAQARDWLLYLLSTVWLNRAQWADWLVLWCDTFQRMSPAVQSELSAATLRLSWLRWLPRSRKVLGRDIAQAQALAEFMSQQRETPSS